MTSKITLKGLITASLSLWSVVSLFPAVITFAPNSFCLSKASSLERPVIEAERDDRRFFFSRNA